MRLPLILRQNYLYTIARDYLFIYFAFLEFKMEKCLVLGLE